MNFSGLMIGPSHLHVQYVMTKSGFAFLLAIFLIMVGIIGLINEISQKYLKYRYSRNSLYLSGIIGGYWIMIESNVPILLLPDSTELLLLTKYLSLLVFPVPAFCLITSILPHKTKSWTIALMVVDVISIVAAFAAITISAQTVNVHFKNGQTIEFPSAQVDFVDFFAKPSDPTLTAGQVVDLGLSVYWASCNLGAEKPESGPKN